MADRFAYLVFHGLASFVHDVAAKRIIVLLVKMPGHVVALGHWMTERPVPEGVGIKVTGLADDGTKFLDETRNAIVPMKTDPDLSAAYAHFDLPLAEEVFSLRKVDLAGVLKGKDAGKLTSKSHHSVQVLKYKLTDDRLTFSGKKFKFTSLAVASVPPVGPLTVIHILNEPPNDLPAQHGIDEFRKGAEALGSDLAIKKALKFPSAGTDVLPPGLLPAEVLPLANRDFHLNSTLLELRRHTPVLVSEAIGGSRVCGTASGTKGGS